VDTKSFKFEVKDIDEQGIFEGYAAVFGNIARTGDVIEPGAFRKTLQENPQLPILWQHNPAEPIGLTVAAVEDNRGLRVKGQLNLETARGREAYALMKQGVLRGLSIGYDTVKEAWEGTTRKLKEIRLWEWSLVTFPANPLAQVESIKAVVPFQDLPLADMETPWDGNAARMRVREWAGGEDNMDWEKYRRAFVWYDAEKPELFGSYKLPIADVIDGRLKAVPRGIFAAAAAVQGSRGGVDIPDRDIAGVKNHLARYYEKMDRTPPWSSESSGLDLLLYGIIGAAGEIKAGRMNETMNTALIEQAIQSLNALLGKAEPDNSTQQEGKPQSDGELESRVLEEAIEELRKLKEVL